MAVTRTPINNFQDWMVGKMKLKGEQILIIINSNRINELKR